MNNNFTNPLSPTSTSNASNLSQSIQQVPSTPQASPIRPTSILPHTPIRRAHTLVSPSIQNRIDSLLQNARGHNFDTQNQVTHSPHLPYNFRPRRR